MNAMTYAFSQAQVSASFTASSLTAVIKAIDKQPKVKEGWSFSGSYKTFQALKAQGKIS